MDKPSHGIWEPKSHADTVACSECGLTMAQAKTLAAENTELADAHKRIRVLENWQETVRSSSMLVNQRDRAIADLAAERELSIKLVNALKVAQKFCSQLSAEDCPDVVAIPINAALAEAAAIRTKGEQG